MMLTVEICQQQIARLRDDLEETSKRRLLREEAHTMAVIQDLRETAHLTESLQAWNAKLEQLQVKR